MARVSDFDPENNKSVLQILRDMRAAKEIRDAAYGPAPKDPRDFPAWFARKFAGVKPAL